MENDSWALFFECSLYNGSECPILKTKIDFFIGSNIQNMDFLIFDKCKNHKNDQIKPYILKFYLKTDKF